VASRWLVAATASCPENKGAGEWFGASTDVLFTLYKDTFGLPVRTEVTHVQPVDNKTVDTSTEASAHSIELWRVSLTEPYYDDDVQNVHEWEGNLRFRGGA